MMQRFSPQASGCLVNKFLFLMEPEGSILPPQQPETHSGWVTNSKKKDSFLRKKSELSDVLVCLDYHTVRTHQIYCNIIYGRDL
jgi:hypothetical protein